MESFCWREKNNNKKEKKKNQQEQEKKISEREKHKKRGCAVHNSAQNKHWMWKNTITHPLFPTLNIHSKLFISAFCQHQH